jgi:TolB-like protein
MLLLMSKAFAGTLAVLYFENQGAPALDPLKVGLAQMMISDLQGAGDTKLVERQRLQAILDELKLGHDGMVDPATAARVGKLLGADELLLGSYFELMGTLRMDARLVRVETGEVLHATGANDKTENFLLLEKQLSAAFRTALTTISPVRGVLTPPPAPAVQPTATVDVARPDAKAMDAALAFSEGLIALDQKELSRARESFQKAVAADPRLEEAKTQLAAMAL